MTTTPDDNDLLEDDEIERHSLECCCADCSGAELTTDND